MNNIINKVLQKVNENSQVCNIVLTVNELVALDTIAYVLSKELNSFRDQLESTDIAIDIEQSLFIDSLISASNKLNNADLTFSKTSVC